MPKVGAQRRQGELRPTIFQFACCAQPTLYNDWLITSNFYRFTSSTSGRCNCLDGTFWRVTGCSPFAPLKNLSKSMLSGEDFGCVLRARTFYSLAVRLVIHSVVGMRCVL